MSHLKSFSSLLKFGWYVVISLALDYILVECILCFELCPMRREHFVVRLFLFFSLSFFFFHLLIYSLSFQLYFISSFTYISTTAAFLILFSSTCLPNPCSFFLLLYRENRNSVILSPPLTERESIVLYTNNNNNSNIQSL